MDNWKNNLKQCGVEVDDAIARFCNKEERYLKYLKLFYNDNAYNQLIEAIKSGDVKEAFENCHNLKGVVTSLGFASIYPTICEVCEILRAGRIDNTLDMVTSVQSEYTKIIKIIENDIL